MRTLFAMGPPTSATAAIMPATIQQYVIQPGPLLFDRNADLMCPLPASLLTRLTVLLILRHYLHASITLFCALGVYAGITPPITWVLYGLMTVMLIGAACKHYRNEHRNGSAQDGATIADAPGADQKDAPHR